MAKIASKVVWWSSVSDAAAYNVRIIPDGTDFSYDFAPDAAQPAIIGQPEQELDLAGLQLAEGVYTVYVTAEDLAGNESDPLVLAASALDFTPPSAPTSGGFRN